jgi:OOP family OmpA-OmpF porin
MRRAVVVAVAVTVATAARPAAAERAVELGGLIGRHRFNDDNELGVVDAAEAASLRAAAVFGVRVGVALVPRLVLEGELVAMPTEVIGHADVDAVGLHTRLHALVRLGDGRLVPFALLGGGLASVQSSDPDVLQNDIDVIGELGGGALMRGGRDWGTRLDVRAQLAPSSAGGGVTTDLEITLGLYRRFGGRPAATAAPDDGDGDGVLGAADRCPERPEDHDGNADDDGCPETDDDGDHIADVDDRCPRDPERINGFEDDDGCPDADPDRDEDGDGLVGAADRCGTDAEDQDGFEDDDGCPDPDDDGDGVADPVDRCPAELEIANGWRDDDGCADQLPAELARVVGVLAKVRFRPGSDVLAPSATRPLDALAAALLADPTLRIEVSGHTDDQGDRDERVAASLRRAEAVESYLVAKGVAKDRVVAVGFGPDRPLPSAGGAARASERIEIRLLRAAEGQPAPAPR